MNSICKSLLTINSPNCWNVGMTNILGPHYVCLDIFLINSLSPHYELRQQKILSSFVDEESRAQSS